MSVKDREVFISVLNKKLLLMSFSSWLALSLASASSCNWTYPKKLQFSFLFWNSCRSFCSRAPRGCPFLSYSWICEPLLSLDKGFLVLLRNLVEKCRLLSLYFSLISVLISPMDVFLSLASDVYFDFFFNWKGVTCRKQCYTYCLTKALLYDFYSPLNENIVLVSK